MAHEVFISYSQKDAAVAEAVCAELEAKGIQCWIAPRNIVSGTKYSQSIINGITQSQLMVVVYSANANESNHVVAEIDRAYNKRMPIIPFRIEDVPLSPDLEYYLSTSQWLDALDGQTKQHLERLVETVRLLLKKTGSLPKPPPPPRSTPPRSPITATAKSSKTPWLIAGVTAAVALGVVGVLLIAVILLAIRAGNSNVSVANQNTAAVPGPTTNSNVRETIQRRTDSVETELMKRARKGILDAEISGDKQALDGLLHKDFRARRDNQILTKEQFMSEVDNVQLIEGLRVPDRRKVSVTVDDARSGNNNMLMSTVKITYLDGGRTITEVRRDITLFMKENDRFIATVNRWSADAPSTR